MRRRIPTCTPPPADREPALLLRARIQGIGFWCQGLPSWAAARALAAGAPPDAAAPKRPAPQLLAPNERRRAPESVAVALEAALAACRDAGRDPAGLACVFASTHGDMAITDYMSATLASGDPGALSPTRFHNSVHNAAAGYWTIGVGCTAPATAISAYQASFAQGLLEALAQLACDHEAVLLVAYDGQAVGPAATLWRSRGLLGGALVLARAGDGPDLRAGLADGEGVPGDGPLAQHAAGNAMAPMLPLFDALAAGAEATLALPAGPPGRILRVRLSP